MLDDKALATVIAGLVCGLLIIETGGAHGIGWFIVALLIIW